MAEDKRITKTKKNLRHTMITLLDQKPFDKISVSELCAVAGTSRITFYTYYSDKQALIKDMIRDYYVSAESIYHDMQSESNPENEARRGYANLLECILKVIMVNRDFFSHVSMETNPVLCSIFYLCIRDSVADYIMRHGQVITSRYPASQTASLLCMGLLGVLHETYYANTDFETALTALRAMYNDLIDSRLFMQADEISP